MGSSLWKTQQPLATVLNVQWGDRKWMLHCCFLALERGCLERSFLVFVNYLKAKLGCVELALPLLVHQPPVQFYIHRS